MQGKRRYNRETEWVEGEIEKQPDTKWSLAAARQCGNCSFLFLFNRGNQSKKLIENVPTSSFAACNGHC